MILTSTDGASFYNITPFNIVIDNLTASVWTNNRTFLLGTSGTILTSSDGITWASQNSGVTVPLVWVYYYNSKYIIRGNNGVLLTSTNAVNWTIQPTGITSNINDFSANTTNINLACDNGNIIRSTDSGSTWSVSNIGTASSLRSVRYNTAKTILVEVGDNGIIYRSTTDGATWTTQTSGTSNSLREIIWGNNIFVAKGFYGTIVTSPDGITWTVQNSNTGNNINDIIWNSTLGQYVAVGNNKTIITSPDAITWTVQNSGL